MRKVIFGLLFSAVFSLYGTAQANVPISVDKASGDAPLQVTFTAQAFANSWTDPATGNTVSIMDRGDRYISFGDDSDDVKLVCQNPTSSTCTVTVNHTYDEPGTYDAVLFTAGFYGIQNDSQYGTRADVDKITIRVRGSSPIEGEYDSCVDAYENGETESGYYSIDGIGRAYCDMDTNGGGWLRITPELARDEFNGKLRFEDGKSNTDYGFDGNDRPYTRDDTGAHTAHYTFDLPVEMSEFMLFDYYAKSNSAPDDSSDLYGSRFTQTSWDKAHDKSVGDVSFGFADDNGPITSFAKELSDDTLVTHNQRIKWPRDEKIYKTNNPSDRFRIGWGDEGGPKEGWFPWWSGSILIRERAPKRPLEIDIRYARIEDDNDVVFKTRVSGNPDDEDTEMRVQYEDREGGRCRGDWEPAYIKKGATATNEDGGDEPSVDNNKSYQIGSKSGERVIADGTNNTVRFTWDAERDLGKNLEGKYCVRVTVRADSGESDMDTYIVDFGTSPDPDTDSDSAPNPTPRPNPSPRGGVTIVSPVNGATVETNNPAIIGTGIPGQTVTVAAVGKQCTARVMSTGGWTCTLTLLPAGTYKIVATQRNNYGQITGTDTAQFTIPGKKCPVFTKYHKLGDIGGEVPKIQEFLKSRGYYTGPITGYYDYATDRAIRSFQLEFKELILDPWRLPAPTGNWYKTSRKHANFLSGCYETVYLEGIGITF